MDLASIDLNLLVVFDAIMAERHVTRAGERIGLSQPAVSAALNRLRYLVKDELFIRRSDGMHPTRRAQELAVPLRQALVQIQAALEVKVFESATATRTFKLAINDFAASVLVPRLGERLSVEAPNVSLQILQADDILGLKLLDGDVVDLAVAPFENAPAQFQYQQLLEPAGFLCTMRKGHPLANQPLTIELFAQTPQLLISRTGDPTGFVDEILAEVGHQRRVAFTVPSFLLAPIVLAKTDYIAVLPQRLVEMFQDKFELVSCEPPFAQKKFSLGMLWHRRLSNDPGLFWLRTTLKEVASKVT